MKVRNLAEAIIFQSIEDLWDEDHREGCIRFFAGEEFTTCAEIAGMSLSEQLELLNIVRGLINQMKKPVKEPAKATSKYSGHRYSARRAAADGERQLTL